MNKCMIAKIVAPMNVIVNAISFIRKRKKVMRSRGVIRRCNNPMSPMSKTIHSIFNRSLCKVQTKMPKV